MSEAATKTCPQCISEVPGEAQVCRHCRYVWPGSGLGQKRARIWTAVFAVAFALFVAAVVWMMYKADTDASEANDCVVDEIVLNEDLDCGE